MTDLPGGMPDPRRDLRGHMGQPPDPRWPGGARLALSFVVNVEEGAELSLTSGDARNESIYEAREEVEGHPDPCMESHYGYGARVGLWRILDAFGRHGLHATFSACGRAVASPRFAERLAQLGFLPRQGGPRALRDFVASEIARYRPIVELAGIRVE